MQKLQAVIFDMDGVIVDSSWYWIKVLSNIIAEQGYTISQNDVNEISGCSDDYELEILSRYIHKEKEELRELRTNYILKHPIHYSNHIKKGVIDLLKFLKDNSIKIALASSSPMADINRMIDEVDIRSYFDFIISGEMFEQSKPDPAIYNETVRLLNISRENVYVIEDSLYGIQAALGANLRALVLKTPEFDFSQYDYQQFDTHDDIKMYIKKVLKEDQTNCYKNDN